MISTGYRYLGNKQSQKQSQQGECHHTCGLAIYITMYLKAKEELLEVKYFTMPKYNLQKKPLQDTTILQDIITE
jgi:hypothetical protein